MDAWVIRGSNGDSAAARAPVTVGRSPVVRRSSSTATTGVASSSGAPPRSTTGAGDGASVRSTSRCPAARSGCTTVGAQCTRQPSSVSGVGRSSSSPRYCQLRSRPSCHVTSTAAVAPSASVRTCPRVAVRPSGSSALRVVASSSTARAGSSVRPAARASSPADHAARKAVAVSSGPVSRKSPQPAVVSSTPSTAVSAVIARHMRAGGTRRVLRSCAEAPRRDAAISPPVAARSPRGGA